MASAAETLKAPDARTRWGPNCRHLGRSGWGTPIRKQIAQGLFWGAFINNGQTCAALKRLYVHDDIFADVCSESTSFAKTIPVGDGLDEKNVLGPVQNRMQLDKVAHLTESGKRRPRADGRQRAGPGLVLPDHVHH